jgi:group II intron reverse transcriptase/maturase
MGMSAFEEKLIQDAVREVLEAIDAQDFLDSSYGFRPGRSAHDALRTLDPIVHRGEVRWVWEADMGSFFDSVDRTELKKRLEMRVADGALRRLMGQCVHVGVLDGEAWSEPEMGTTHGSVLSPLLGNVSRHDVLDRWFATAVQPRRRGQATLIRSGDDCMIGFEREDEARRVRTALGTRLGRFGLTLHPDKTRRLPFGGPRVGQHGGRGPATCDFVGFTCYWARSRKGPWGMWCQTRRASLRRAKQAIDDWWRRHRHQSVQAHHAALSRRLRGHCTSFGVHGNWPSLLRLVEATKRAWYKWRCRRSQRARLTWERFTDLLRRWPLPRPRITVRIWGV